MVGGSDRLRSGLIAAELVLRAASLTEVENVKPLCIKGFTRLTNGRYDTVVHCTISADNLKRLRKINRKGCNKR